MKPLTIVEKISVGDRVKSYDFPVHLEHGDLERAEQCYVEGVVVEIADPSDNRFNHLGLHCPCYQIFVDKRVFGGKDVTDEMEDGYIYPPINGLGQLFSSKLTHGVKKIG